MPRIEINGIDEQLAKAPCPIDIELPSITVVSNDINGGTVSGVESDNIYNIDVNSSYAITATPKEGYRFDRWSDGNSAGNTRIFTKEDLTSHETIITAIFVPYYTLTYKP